MDPLIIDKAMSELLADIVKGRTRSQRAQGLLWAIALHDGCIVPPFYSDSVYSELSILEKRGLLTYQDSSCWDSYRSSMNPVLCDAVELRNQLTPRIKLKQSDEFGFQKYRYEVGDVKESVAISNSVLTANVKGLAGVIEKFAETWQTKIRRKNVILFSDLNFPEFVGTLGNIEPELAKSPTLLEDWVQWFGDAWTEHINEFVDKNFSFWRSSFNNIDEAHLELSPRYGRSFKHFCKTSAASVPAKWFPDTPGHNAFQNALENYLFAVAEQVYESSTEFPEFWNLAYKTLYLASEAEFYGAAICAVGANDIAQRLPNGHTEEECLRIVRVVEKEKFQFPRIRSLTDLQRLINDKNFPALKEKIWAWKQAYLNGSGLDVDNLSKEIRSDLADFKALPRMRNLANAVNCLAMTATALDLIASTCLSAAFLPIGVYFHQRVKLLEGQTSWCMVGDG